MNPAATPPSSAPRGGSGAMFDGIAKRYDLLNRLISLGIDQSWRRDTVGALNLDSGRVLDLATGTADLALLTAKMLPHTRVVGLDPSDNMMSVGRDKITAAGLSDRIELVHGDAERLPFEHDSFDGITMAFGIRNVPDRSAALREMARVTRPGKRICILELSEPQAGIRSGLARFHMHTLVPLLGSLLSGSREYRYLPKSIAAFPPPEQFAELMASAGIEVHEARALKLGVCHLYVGASR